MSYKSNIKLDLLILNALDDPEITRGLVDVHLTKTDIKAYLNAHEKDVFLSFEPEIESFDNDERVVQDFKKTESESRKKKWLFFRILRVLGITGFTILIAAVNLDLFDQSSRFFRWVSEHLYQHWAKFNGAVFLFRVLFCSVLCLVLYLGHLFVDFLEQRFSIKAWVRWMSNNPIEVQIYRTALERNRLLEGHLDELVVEKSIKGLIREQINSRMEASYALKLTSLKAHGLAELMDVSRSIDTTAKKKLDFLIDSMPGGSIGIAGPRGAGKSTLIRSICERSILDGKLFNLPMLSVFTTSPVKYDSREFILHLFYLTCKNVSDMRGEGHKDDETEPLSEDKMLSTLSAFFFGICKFWLVFLTLGLVFAFSSFGIWNQHIHFMQLRRLKKVIPTDFASYLYDAISRPESRAAEVMILGISFMLFGMLSLLMLTFRRYFSLSISRTVKFRERVEGINDLEISTNRDALYGMADKWMDKIKLQKSFTTTDGGGFKLPIGLERSMSHAATISEYPMSNPEIISHFSDFLKSVCQEFQVIIGIDELDKLESDLNATAFLNEIKSVFGIPRCFFLISVSENALSNFDRRGLPFRDVFDSSFDNIVYVGALSLEDSKKLLERRVVGRQMIFFDLAYCLSGGLPRDVIRYYREIVRFAQIENTLQFISNSIFKEDVISKSRAIITILSQSQSSAHFDKLCVVAVSLIDTTVNIAQLDKTIEKIIDIVEVLSVDIDKTMPLNVILLSSARELYIYLAFISTLWTLFNSDVTEEEIKALEDGDFFNVLATIRRTFSTNHALAFAMINIFREKRGMGEYATAGTNSVIPQP